MLYFPIALFFSSILLISNSIIPFTYAQSDSNYSTFPTELQVPDVTKMSPLKQFKLGLGATSIFCKKEFQLMIKTDNGFPACVRSQTMQTLVERGWGKFQEQTVWFEYNFMACQKTPWREWGKNLQGVYTENDLIREYFKVQGITILDAKIDSVHFEGVPVCGVTFLSGYYFLVYAHDKDKMINLGYELYTISPPKDAIPTH